MAVTTRIKLKSLFRNGFIPSEKDFADIFDSFLHKSDDTTVVNFRGNYDPDTSYSKSDLVVKSGAVYLCLLPNKGTDVSDVNSWLILISPTIYSKETLIGVTDQSNAVFTISNPFDDIEIYKNGLRQSEGADCDFVFVDSTTIQFTEPPYSGDVLMAKYTIKVI